MNSYMRNTILACTSFLISSKQNMRTAAMENDGTISRKEQKIIEKFNKLTDKYIKDLQKIK